MQRHRWPKDGRNTVGNGCGSHSFEQVSATIARVRSVFGFRGTLGFCRMRDVKIDPIDRQKHLSSLSLRYPGSPTCARDPNAIDFSQLSCSLTWSADASSCACAATSSSSSSSTSSGRPTWLSCRDCSYEPSCLSLDRACIVISSMVLGRGIGCGGMGSWCGTRRLSERRLCCTADSNTSDRAADVRSGDDSGVRRSRTRSSSSS